MKIKKVHGPEDVIAICKEHPSQDFILSLLDENILRELFKKVKQGVFDFDGTLISGLNQWSHIQNLLPKHFRDDEDKDRAWFFAKEDNFGKSEYPQNDEWMNDSDTFDKSANEGAYGARSIMRWASAGLTSQDIKTAGSQACVRPGVKELFNYFGKVDIITFGIEQFVMGMLEANNLKARVAGYRLIYDEHGVIRSLHPKVVVSSTKGLIVQAMMKREKITPENILFVGDSIVDLDMMPNGGVNVLIFPKDDLNKKILAAREKDLKVMWYSGKLTCIVVSDTFYPICDMLGIRY